VVSLRLFGANFALEVHKTCFQLISTVLGASAGKATCESCEKTVQVAMNAMRDAPSAWGVSSVSGLKCPHFRISFNVNRSVFPVQHPLNYVLQIYGYDIILFLMIYRQTRLSFRCIGRFCISSSIGEYSLATVLGLHAGPIYLRKDGSVASAVARAYMGCGAEPQPQMQILWFLQ
jgi:hypothetical protein